MNKRQFRGPNGCRVEVGYNSDTASLTIDYPSGPRVVLEIHDPAAVETCRRAVAFTRPDGDTAAVRRLADLVDGTLPGLFGRGLLNVVRGVKLVYADDECSALAGAAV